MNLTYRPDQIPAAIARCDQRLRDIATKRMSLSGYAEGGFVDGPGVQVTVEHVGQCPNGHPWLRIGASPHVEHIANLDDLAPLSCAYRVHYLPQEGKK